MIISHKYRFIFIKTHKTAGSSIERYLSDLCGPDDVLTTMDPSPAGHRPRNWIGNSALDKAYAKYNRVRKIVHRDSMFLTRHYYQHMAGERIRALCGEDTWNRYFKFCIERNPWDKVVSFYWWKMRAREEAVPFSQWIREKKLPVDADLYFLNGQVGVDCIGRFEHLNDHLAAIFDHLGLPRTFELPREKVGISKTQKHYSELYQADDIDFISELYSREIGLLGYRYDGNHRSTDIYWGNPGQKE